MRIDKAYIMLLSNVVKLLAVAELRSRVRHPVGRCCAPSLANYSHLCAPVTMQYDFYWCEGSNAIRLHCGK